MKACIVDDDFTSLILLGEFLEDQGWDASTFHHPNKPNENGKTLEDALSLKDTKLLIMDVRFGRDKEGLMLGLKTVEKLVESDQIKSECGVLFVSQFGQEDINFSSTKKLLESKGIQCDWLDKPVDFIQLAAKVHNL